MNKDQHTDPIEREVEEFKYKTDNVNFHYQKKPCGSLDDTDHLLYTERYPESSYELDRDKIIDWLRASLTRIQQETERMVRMKCIQEIEEARAEHNDARHGSSDSG